MLYLKNMELYDCLPSPLTVFAGISLIKQIQFTLLRSVCVTLSTDYRGLIELALRYAHR